MDTDKKKWPRINPRVPPQFAERFREWVQRYNGKGGTDENGGGALFLWLHTPASMQRAAIDALHGRAYTDEAFWRRVEAAMMQTFVALLAEQDAE